MKKKPGPVVERIDNTIPVRTNDYLVHSVARFVNTYPLDDDLSGGYISVIHPLNNKALDRKLAI